MASERLQFSIPWCGVCTNNLILLVLLGQLFYDKTKVEKICRVIDARSLFVLAGNSHLLPIYVFARDVEKDIFDNSGVCQTSMG